MEVSIEYYLLVNLGMNCLTLAAIARCRGQVRWIALICAAAAGAVYAVLMQLAAFSALKHPALRIALTLLMAVIALRPVGMRDALSAMAMLLGGSALLGGAQLVAMEVVHARAGAALALGGALGTLLLLSLFRAKINRMEKWEVQVVAFKRGQQARFTALIDTGNRLHEPISGLPVMIVEQRRIERLLPYGFCEGEAHEGFRRVAYGGMGGNGYLSAFRPDELLVNYSSGWMRAPAIWIGVYPGRMPGGVCALAPALLGTVGAESARKQAQ